jgi:hypothetical protein
VASSSAAPQRPSIESMDYQPVRQKPSKNALLDQLKPEAIWTPSMPFGKSFQANYRVGAREAGEKERKSQLITRTHSPGTDLEASDGRDPQSAWGART